MPHLPIVTCLLTILTLAFGLLSTGPTDGAIAFAQSRSAPGEAPTDDEEKSKGNDASCVTHTTQSRFVSGYDHLVHVTNGCAKTAVCQISTDVNPKPQSLTLAPGKKDTVLTYRGSPASEFKATVACELKDTP